MVSLWGVTSSFADSLHVITTHQKAIDHHHHDEFSLHFDHEDTSLSHQHNADGIQHIALLCKNNFLLTQAGISRLQIPLFESPTSAFLKVPFRPPQFNL